MQKNYISEEKDCTLTIENVAILEILHVRLRMIANGKFSSAS